MAWQMFSFMPNSKKCQRCLRPFVNYVPGLYMRAGSVARVLWRTGVRGSLPVGRKPLDLRTPPNMIRISPIGFAPFARFALFFDSATKQFACKYFFDC